MNFSSIYSKTESRSFDVGLMNYMNSIFKNMSIALFISAIVAVLVGNNTNLFYSLFKNKALSLIISLSPLIFSFYMYSQIWKVSTEKAKMLLYIFAGLMGLSLSTIFVVYTKGSILNTFLTAGCTFGAMSIYGYRTKIDLSSLRSFLIMGVVGVLIASLINIFTRSSMLHFVITLIGLFIFILYTAYDVQNLKNSYYEAQGNTQIVEKIAIVGALELYMDFVNIFIYLLQLMGDRKE